MENREDKPQPNPVGKQEPENEVPPKAEPLGQGVEPDQLPGRGEPSEAADPAKDRGAGFRPRLRWPGLRLSKRKPKDQESGDDPRP